jgi:hypothetical protein
MYSAEASVFFCLHKVDNIIKDRGNYIFSHKLLFIVNMSSRTDTITKRENRTTIYIPKPHSVRESR